MNNKNIAYGLTLAMALAGPVLAAPSSKVAWNQETVAMVKAADAEKGKQLAVSCAGCHGAEGVANNNTWPSLAGQDAATTYKQLKDYKDGTRAGGMAMMMAGVVAGLSDQDMADLGAYYASLPLPPAQGEASAKPALVSEGDGHRLVPACSSCHGRHGEGNARSHGMPVLAGQNLEYIKATMRAYRDGTRGNDVYGVMRKIAKDLTDAEIDEVSAYYAAQGN
jgi:cytochrome c553